MSDRINPMLGKYVIVRCRDAGVHAGVLEYQAGRECTLTDARRLWYWKVAPGAGDFLNGVALKGLAKGSKVGASVPRIHLTENCEIIETSSEAETAIREYATHGA